MTAPSDAAAAVASFAATNLDDLLVLALLFGRARGATAGARRVWLGQYVGFVAILILSVAASAGVGLLPEGVIAYLGFVPIGVGVAVALEAWRGGAEEAEEAEERVPAERSGGPARSPGVLSVAAITIANGGDNLGVYVPMFATSGGATIATHVAVYLALVAVWCAAGQWLAARPTTARVVERWGHVIVPVVFVAIGVAILVEGGAFGL